MDNSKRERERKGKEEIKSIESTRRHVDPETPPPREIPRSFLNGWTGTATKLQPDTYPRYIDRQTLGVSMHNWSCNTVVADVVLVIMDQMVAERMLAWIVVRAKFRRAVRSLSRVPRRCNDALPNLFWPLYLLHCWGEFLFRRMIRSLLFSFWNFSHICLDG